MILVARDCICQHDSSANRLRQSRHRGETFLALDRDARFHEGDVADQPYDGRAPDELVSDARARLKRWGKPDAVIDEYVNAFDELLSFFPAQEWKGRYQGTTEQRALLRSWTSWLVSRYVREGISLNAAGGATAALSSSEDDEHARTVIDMISGMTEVQALRLHARLLGVSLGSVLDRL